MPEISRYSHGDLVIMVKPGSDVAVGTIGQIEVGGNYHYFKLVTDSSPYRKGHVINFQESYVEAFSRAKYADILEKEIASKEVEVKKTRNKIEELRLYKDAAHQAADKILKKFKDNMYPVELIKEVENLGLDFTGSEMRLSKDGIVDNTLDL